MFISYLNIVNKLCGGSNLAKFKFKTKKNKNRFNFITDNGEILNEEIIKGVHIEIFSNQKMILEGCKSIVDYRSDYIKLKFKKGNFSVFGKDFLISDFEDERIIIKGEISSVEFCV